MAYEKLLAEYKRAHEYISKIGKPQPHYRDGSVGKLYELKISTKINHQYSTGSTNYHCDQNFDIALTEVIVKEFNELSKKALILMDKQAKEALFTEEAGLRERLKLVEEMKDSLND